MFSLQVSSVSLCVSGQNVVLEKHIVAGTTKEAVISTLPGVYMCLSL